MAGFLKYHLVLFMSIAYYYVWVSGVQGDPDLFPKPMPGPDVDVR